MAAPRDGRDRPRAVLALGPVLAGLLRVRPPSLAIRALMVGMDADRALVELVGDALSRVSAGTLLARVRESAATDVRRELAELRVPIVWIRASRDRLVSAGATHQALAARPGLDVRVIAGPHLLAQARPRELAEIIRLAGSR